MRITFVLPFAYFTGGVRVVIDHASRLRARGHTTTTVFPCLPYWFQDARGVHSGLRPWLGGLRRNLLRGGLTPGQPVRGEMQRVPWVDAAFLPDADVVVATAWPTAYSVARLPRAKGVPCYLVQHREIDSGPVARVDATYRLPLHRIAISHDTQRRLRSEVGVEVEDVAAGGTDVAFWSGGGVPAAGRAGVLIPLHDGERKGAADGISALARVHRARPDVPVRAFGPRRRRDVPAWIEYVERPSDVDLRALYVRSRVFVFASRFEGFGLPPLEAMAAGCCVVSTRVGAVPDFAQDGETALLVEPGDVEGLAERVLQALGDEPRAARIGACAAEAARAHDLDRSTDAFLAALEHAVAADRRRV